MLPRYLFIFESFCPVVALPLRLAPVYLSPVLLPCPAYLSAWSTQCLGASLSLYPRASLSMFLSICTLYLGVCATVEEVWSGPGQTW